MNRQTVSRRRIPPIVPQPEAHDIRLVAIDLDGTLLNDSKQVSRQTIDGLTCAIQRGVSPPMNR